MSGQHPIRPEQGSYSQFQAITSQSRPPYSRDKVILAKLRESIPQNESQWQQARHLHSYITEENALQKTRDILENRITKQDLRHFISIASCCVDWHLGRKQEAYKNFKIQISSATELTIQRYMASVRGMVRAMDTLFLRGLRHRVFEATLLYSRIGPSFLPYYTKETEEFNSCFPAFSYIQPEIQASLPLTPVFIVKYRYPEHSFEDICKALCTEVLDEDAYATFISVLETGRPIPIVLSLPVEAPHAALSVSRCQYESVGDDPEFAAGPSNDIQFVGMFALPRNFPLVYKVFSTSDTVQKLVEELSHQISRENPQEVPNTPLSELQWTAHYDPVVNQVIGDLIEQNILPQQPFQRYKSFYQHEPGSIAVSSGWLKIILPSALDQEACWVSISGPTVEKQNIIWDNQVGLILGSGMLFSTSHRILYYSVSIPHSSRSTDR
ncbi:hypothetical protein F53441_13347 [Fusarium austroafricanum]|uniref:Uncharacterized protein n=1 Tax=Fusarium austroafricanum TaxID=2364996 RepID=A0A8H4JSI0_9HYPO|nr:hypothetical protein F53441_13347 [Fusarium austroafricanum]